MVVGGGSVAVRKSQSCYSQFMFWCIIFQGKYNKMIDRKLTYGTGYKIADRTSTQRYCKTRRRNRNLFLLCLASQPSRNTQGTSQYMRAPPRELQINEY